MKIKVKEIPREGLEINEQVSSDKIGFSAEELKIISPLTIAGEVHKDKNLVIAEVSVEGQYEFLCARCLDPVIVNRTDDFDISIDIDPTTDWVDLGEEIRQELLVTVSNIVLCKKDCKGLCPSCAANLNKEKCECAK